MLNPAPPPLPRLTPARAESSLDWLGLVLVFGVFARTFRTMRPRLRKFIPPAWANLQRADTPGWRARAEIRRLGRPFFTWTRRPLDGRGGIFAITLTYAGALLALVAFAGASVPFNQRWPLLLGFVGMICIGTVMLILRGGHIRARRALERRCISCGYDLRAAKDVCPECGTPVPERSQGIGS